jgi:hypothetical protein
MKNAINIIHTPPSVRLKKKNKDVNNIKIRMKSTKIEDIIETVDEDIIDDVRNDDSVNNELKMQLDSLQNELSNMKQSEYVDSVQRSIHVPKPITTNVTTPITSSTIASASSSASASAIDKMMTFKNDDFKNAIIMILLFILLNSTQVSELIDMYMPYSIYTYGYIVKAILYFVLYRIVVTFVIS